MKILFSKLCWWRRPKVTIKLEKGDAWDGPDVDRDQERAKRTREIGYPEVLVCHVTPEVAAAQVSRLKELTDASDIWNALLSVAGVMQRDMTRRAMNASDSSMTMGEWIDTMRGVAMFVAELDALRKGVDGSFVRAELNKQTNK